MRIGHTALVLLVLHIYNGATYAAASCQQAQGNFTEGSYIYTVCQGPMSWNDSAASCMAWTNGGVLATFENLPQLRNVTDGPVWLGGRQHKGWTWLDGTAVNTSVNSDGDKNCMAIHRNNTIAVPCNNSVGRHYLCQMNSHSSCKDHGQNGSSVLNSNDRCVKIFNQRDDAIIKLTWLDARDECRNMGAQLASLASDLDTVNRNLANIGMMYTNLSIYVGGQYFTWRWAHNASLSTSQMSRNMTKQLSIDTGGHASPSQPHCLLLKNNHLLGTSCDKQHSYLCQAPVVAATTDSSISTVAAPVASADSDDTHTLAIILGAVGGVITVLIIVIVVLVICIRRKRSKKNDTRSGDFEYHDTIFNNSRGSSTSRSAGSDQAHGPDDTADPGYSTITDVTPSPTPGSMTVAADSHNHTEVGHLDRPVADGGQSVSTNNTHGGRTSFPYSEIRNSQMGQKNGFSKAAAAGPSTSAGQNFGYSEIGAASPNPDDDGYSRAKAIPPDSFGYSRATKIADGTVNDAYEDDEQPGPSSPKVSVLASNNKAGKGKRGRAYPYASTRIESIIAREDKEAQHVRDHDQKEGGALNSLKKRLSLLLKRNHPQSRDVLPTVQQSPSTGSGPDVVPASHYEEVVGVSGQGSTLTTHSDTSGTMSSQLPNPGEDLDILDNVSYGHVHN